MSGVGKKNCLGKKDAQILDKEVFPEPLKDMEQRVCTYGGNVYLLTYIVYDCVCFSSENLFQIDYKTKARKVLTLHRRHTP